MRAYSEMSDYFQKQQVNHSLEKVFQLFLYSPKRIAELFSYPPDFLMSNQTLQAEFLVHHVFEPTRENGALVSGIDLLRKKRDMKNLPVLAYALAGEVHTNHFSWLLETLGKELIQTYNNLEWSLTMIAATNGSRERLELLLQYYQPTTDEWLQGLFFSAYHGHLDLFSFILSKINEIKRANNQAELDIHLLRDMNNNTLLHAATFGEREQAIDFFACSASYEYLETRNNRQYRAIDEAALSNNKQLVMQIAYFYSLHQTSIHYGDLILVLIRSGYFLDNQKEMLSHLRQKQINDTAFLEEWIIAAIDAHNKAIVQEFIIDLPHYADMNSLIAHANSNDPIIAFHLSEEMRARHWVQEVMENIVARLGAYIFREEHQLDELALEDGLSSGSYVKTKHTTDASRRVEECRQVLNSLFYGPYFKEIKQLYKRFPTHRRDPALFVGKIILKRQALTRKTRGTEKDTVNFNQQVKETIDKAASFFIEGFSPVRDVIVPEPVSAVILDQMTNTITNEDECDAEMPKFTQKQIHFIDQFVDLFDQTYQLYKCLSAGSVIRRPDAIDHVAEIAKDAAIAMLPHVNVSAPMLGIPLPFSVSLPTGVAVAAVIDLVMYMREKTQQAQAQRVGQFFDGWSPRARTDNIYECAEFLAARFRDQIKPLSNKDSIPRLAEIAVARIFSYAMGSRAHTQKTTSSARSMTVIGLKIISPFWTTGPERVYHRKSLIDIAIDALSKYRYEVFNWETEDQRYLTLDERLLSQGYSRDWTVKGILEHTGIRINGRSYKGTDQDVQQYGYAYAPSPASKTEMDAELARRGGMHECTDIPEFELKTDSAAPMKMSVY